MGTVYTEITIVNAGDLARARGKPVEEQNIREATVNALVDTGAMTLVIGEDLCEKLGLEMRGYKEVSLANDATEICRITEPVEIHWKERESVCFPWVLPGSNEVLLGVIPLEDMDLMVDPKKLELTGRHGEKEMKRLY